MIEQPLLHECLQGEPPPWVRCPRCAGDSMPSVRSCVLAIIGGDSLAPASPTLIARRLEERGQGCRWCSPPNRVHLQMYHLRQDAYRDAGRRARRRNVSENDSA